MTRSRTFQHQAVRLGILAATLGIAACTHPSPPPAPVASENVRPTERPAPPDVISEPAAIASIQEELADMGYDPGKPDGVVGPSTRKAIVHFEKDYGLAEDGLLTPGLAENIKTRAAVLTVAAGDAIMFSDGASETSAAEHTVQWATPDGGHSVVAIRPSTSGWPLAARTGLDWAITHALDGSDTGSAVQWSSTGVHSRFEIRTFPTLSQREMEIVGSDKLCRRFELRSSETHRRYPSLACKDKKGMWLIADSKIALARPVTEIGSQAPLPRLRR